MTLNHEHAPFWVHANNIITGENATFGPFGGPAIITHALLRGGDPDDSDSFHELLFGYFDPEDIGGDDNPHEYERWEGDGDWRYDGWRELKQVVDRTYPDGTTLSSHTEPIGPFFTDLVIHTEPPSE